MADREVVVNLKIKGADAGKGFQNLNEQVKKTTESLKGFVGQSGDAVRGLLGIGSAIGLAHQIAVAGTNAYSTQNAERYGAPTRLRQLTGNVAPGGFPIPFGNFVQNLRQIPVLGGIGEAIGGLFPGAQAEQARRARDTAIARGFETTTALEAEGRGIRNIRGEISGESISGRLARSRNFANIGQRDYNTARQNPNAGDAAAIAGFLSVASRYKDSLTDLLNANMAAASRIQNIGFEGARGFAAMGRPERQMADYVRRRVEGGTPLDLIPEEAKGLFARGFPQSFNKALNKVVAGSPEVANQVKVEIESAKLNDTVLDQIAEAFKKANAGLLKDIELNIRRIGETERQMQKGRELLGMGVRENQGQ